MSSKDSARPEALARFLRQRRELAGRELFLQDLSRDEVRRVLRSVRDDPERPFDTPSDAGESATAGTRADDAGTAEKGGGDDGGVPAPGLEFRAGDAGADAIGSLDHDDVERVALKCERCRLAEERRQVVFFDGNPGARLMVVGEAPGAREDEQGLPFVGPAGKMLDLLLASVDLSREENVYICNVIKCRPPENRNPRPDEIEACAPYLRRQIELVEPEAILAVGTFAGRLLTERSSTLGKLRGEVYSYEGVPLVVTYHPAALLRNRGWTRSTWDDLQLLRDVLDGARPAASADG